MRAKRFSKLVFAWPSKLRQLIVSLRASLLSLMAKTADARRVTRAAALLFFLLYPMPAKSKTLQWSRMITDDERTPKGGDAWWNDLIIHNVCVRFCLAHFLLSILGRILQIPRFYGILLAFDRGGPILVETRNLGVE